MIALSGGRKQNLSCIVLFSQMFYFSNFKPYGQLVWAVFICAPKKHAQLTMPGLQNVCVTLSEGHVLLSRRQIIFESFL